jgi:hypothetical protein
MHIGRILLATSAAALLVFAACEDSKKSDDDKSDETATEEDKNEEPESEDEKVESSSSSASRDDKSKKGDDSTTDSESGVTSAPIESGAAGFSLGDILPKGGGTSSAPTTPLASGDGESCDTLAPKVCSACGADSAACAGWKKVLDMPTMKTQMAGQCGQLTSAIDQLAAIPQAKAQFCATDPMGAAAAAAGVAGEPSESCTKLVDAMCDTCGATSKACQSFAEVAKMPGALASMPESTCDMLVKQLPMVAQVQQTKDMFCGTDFIGAAEGAMGGAGAFGQ